MTGEDHADPNHSGRRTQRRIRQANVTDALVVRRLVDGAMLEIADLEARIDAGDVLVSTAPRPTEPGRRPVGVIVLETSPSHVTGEAEGVPESPGAHVAAITVQRRRRGQGIGRDLIEAALDREGRLTANFDASVRPFYEALAFEIEPLTDGRFRGARTREEPS